jgi:hypothetical protein
MAALFHDKTPPPPAYEPPENSSDGGDADKALAELGYAPVSLSQTPIFGSPRHNSLGSYCCRPPSPPQSHDQQQKDDDSNLTRR